MQAGVTEAMATGRHLDGLPHRLAAERTLEAPLGLLQKLVIKAGHGCLAACCLAVSRLGARRRGLPLAAGELFSPSPRLSLSLSKINHVTSSSCLTRTRAQLRRNDAGRLVQLALSRERVHFNGLLRPHPRVEPSPKGE